MQTQIMLKNINYRIWNFREEISHMQNLQKEHDLTVWDGTIRIRKNYILELLKIKYSK